MDKNFKKLGRDLLSQCLIASIPVLVSFKNGDYDIDKKD